MSRYRLGVALLFPPSVALELDLLRRAFGDPTLDRIPPHLTLVPPVNVSGAAMERAQEVLVRAASSVPGPLVLRLGPATTFAPARPVAHLTIGGPDLADVLSLRDRVFQPPFERPLDHPFVPHVTLAVDHPPDRLAAVVTALGDFTMDVLVDRCWLLVEQRDGDGQRRWWPLLDAAFGGLRVVGRGGLPIELRTTEVADPAAAGLSERHRYVTARRDGRVVGVAAVRAGSVDACDRADTALPVAQLDALSVVHGERGLGVGRQLLSAAELAAAQLGADVMIAADHPFLRHHGWTPDPQRPVTVCRRRS